ncbi:hypothetical protein M422DRAFT_777822 [Sphaerobolus stellatus SS14]|nr:hypothetical protein M422DRAFT_777822 [Sphaerobolus stellatus SS14]
MSVNVVSTSEQPIQPPPQPSSHGEAIPQIKKPPSNCMWDVMDIAIEPVVSDRQIRWGIILSVIEFKLKEIIQESVVLPYMDDVPFFDTTAREIRGGIFVSAFAHPTTLSTTVTTLEKSTTRRRNDRKGHGNIRKRRTWFRKREDEVTPRTLIDTTSSVGEEIAANKSSDVSVSLSDDVPPHEEPDSTSQRQPRRRTVSKPSPSTPTSASAYTQDTIRSMFSSSSAPNRKTNPPSTTSSTPSTISSRPSSCSTDTSSNASSSSKGKDKDKDKDKDGAPSTFLATVKSRGAVVAAAVEKQPAFKQAMRKWGVDDGRDKDGKGGSGDKRDKRANKGGTDRGSYRDVRREREQTQSQSQDRTPRIGIPSSSSSSRETA